LGASWSQVLSMLLRDFCIAALISSFVATPLAFGVMDKWLQHFAYRTEMSWWIFVLAGSSALGVAAFTVSWQAIRASTAHPVEALRYE